MNTRKTLILAAMVLALAMMPLTAQAANYTWTGTASNAWNHDTNWGQTSGSGLFPGSVVGSYADTATIGVSSNNPVSLSTTALLGGGGTALTIGTGSSGTSADLDIASGGTLGMQGNLFITTPTTGSNKNRSITIEGTLRNDSASPGTNYSISGTTTGSHGTETVTLNGGTMSSLNGGGWTFATSDPVSLSGWGTISAPLTVVSNTAFTVSGGILDLNNSLTATANYKGVTVNSGGTLNINTGALLTLTGSSAGNTELVNNGGTVNLNGGTLAGTGSLGSFSALLGGTGAFNVTADSTLTGTLSNDTTNHPGLTPINIGGALGGHTLNLNAFTAGIAGFTVNAGGTLNNQTGPSIVGTINLNGGSVTNTGGGAFSMSGGQIKGYGSVSGFTDFGTGSLNASGGTSSTPQTLAVDGGSGVTLGDSSGVGESMSSAAYNTLDLKGTFNYIQPVTIAPSGGTVQLNGATFATSLTWALSLNPGTVNVTNNSTLGGTVNSSANLTVNSGKNLNASGATFTNNSDGTVFVDHATATWGNFTNNGVYKSDPSTQIFNSLTVGSAGYLTGGAGDVFQIKGDFTNNSTQNTLWSTGAAELDLITGPSHNLALAGADLGATMAGFTNNFAWGTVDLTGQTLSLSDDDGSALYVGKILGVNFTGTTVTNITSDGFDIYYDPGQNPYLNGLTYNLGGEGVLAPVHAVPEPSSIALLGIGAVSLLAYAWRKRRRTA